MLELMGKEGRDEMREMGKCNAKDGTFDDDVDSLVDGKKTTGRDSCVRNDGNVWCRRFG